MVNAQGWLNNSYPTKAEKKVERTQNLPVEELEGELAISNFPNLEKVFVPQNKITKLIIENCPKVKEINVYDNQLIKLEIASLPELEYLNCGNNNLNELNVSENTKLKTLFYFNNPFESQLENLIGVEKLVDLEGLQGKGLIKKMEGEIKIHLDAMERIGNLYRQNPPSEDARLTNILQEIGNDYLSLNRENKQKDLENKELKETIKNLENLIIQTEDNFLSEKIENKCNQLEQLKAAARSDLNANWYEVLEDILEIQEVFIQSNNDLAVGQLKRFKQRLLNSRQINQTKLNEICQVQAELIFLKIKLKQEQKFQTQIEVNHN